MNNQEKFLKETQFELLAQLDKDSTPQWGRMTAQHMVEHLSSLYLFTIEKIKGVTFYEAEKLQRNYNYLIRDQQPFKKNVKIKQLDKLPDLRFESIEVAREKLKGLVEKFYAFYAEDKAKKTMHPACGPLNFEDWEWAHYSHARHHLEQFGLEMNN